MKNTEGSCKLNELVSVAENNRLHRNIEEVENLNEPEEARLMAGFFVLLAFNETSKSKNAI